MPKESPEFFPPSGSFQPVVPLSEIAETPDAVEITPPAPTLPAPQTKRVADAIQARRVVVDESGRRTPEDEEEETLVPTRYSRSTSALAPLRARRKSRLPSWRFIVPCLAALLVGGVIGDALWKNLRRAGAGVEPAHVAAEQPPPGDEIPDARPLPEAVASDAREQTAPPDAPEPETKRPEPAEAENESDGQSPRDARAVTAEITSATVISSSPLKRAAVERPAAESRATRTPPGRDAGDRNVAERLAERPEAAPARRARNSRSPVVTSASRDQSLPVFSPPPSDKSGKKEVIQWP